MGDSKTPSADSTYPGSASQSHLPSLLSQSSSHCPVLATPPSCQRNLANHEAFRCLLAMPRTQNFDANVEMKTSNFSWAETSLKGSSWVSGGILGGSILGVGSRGEELTDLVPSEGRCFSLLTSRSFHKQPLTFSSLAPS